MENSNRCNQCNGKNTRSGRVPHTQIPPQQQKLWRNMRGRTRSSQRTPRSRSKGFPSHRGESDWWRCGSRSPLSFPSRTSKNHWRDREYQALRMSTMEIEQELNRWVRQGGRRPPLYSGGKNQTVTPTLCPSSSGTTAGCSGTTAGTPAVLPLSLQRYYRQLAVLPLAAAVLPLALQRYYRWAPGSAKALPPPRKSSQKGPSTNNR